MSILRIPVARAFEPLLRPARYKGAWGGRGSSKSHFFGGLMIRDHAAEPGLRSVCIREVQKSLKDSAKRLIEDKIEAFDLASRGFRVFREVIETPGDGVILFQGMQDHTADSIKSLEGFGRAWVEEASTLSQRSLDLLRPTIRAEKSEMWFSWNPNRPTDPVDKMLRGANPPTGSTVVGANWADNPWFPSVLEAERRDCEENDPDKYGHIWEGEYARVYAGAYYASHMEAAEQEGRIGEVTADPYLSLRAYWDIGGTSNRSDATAIWVVQFVKDGIRVLEYYEAVGQPFSEHIGWLRARGFGDAEMILPHDGARHDTVFRATPRGALSEAGFKARVMSNAGAGAAVKRIEAARRVLPRCQFNRATTEGGRDALSWYHERRDDTRNIGLGPEHDWSSHGADAFGAMAIDWLARSETLDDWSKPLRRNLKGVA